MDLAAIGDDLVSEVGLSRPQAEVFLFVTIHGKKTAGEISEWCKTSYPEALETARSLQKIGGLIELSEAEFEAMHPRFTAVNMYRRICERDSKKFKPSKIVDGIGALLEEPYYDARTK